ncbi:DUF2634 domain-containing protein [Metabacillus idriensis]|uniref:DUF2634 domain-containing protein n=1 Tax=Metabacillus idriensis TaxID=324768 RepID=UPI0020402E09|nr:DUF2634 domain-containing protein [Metabacillus idriensis]MCM3598722.1 DUF2634 domain-containing protein [Metabacillus idriensis]
MKSFMLDLNGDFVLHNSSFVIIEGDEELAQQVRIAIHTSKGEWFLDPDEGMDRSPLVAKIFDEQAAKDSIIEALEIVSEPLIVEDIYFVRSDRTMHVNLNLRKEDGSLLEVKGVEI